MNDQRVKRTVESMERLLRNRVMYVGITTQTIYGYSGNDIPPPVQSRIKTAELINARTYIEAMEILSKKVLPLRRAADKICEPYSYPDGYGWEVIKLKE